MTTEERTRPPRPMETGERQEPPDTVPRGAAPPPTPRPTTGGTGTPTGGMGGMGGMGGVRGAATATNAGAAPGTVSPTGSGQDARHRGWYWHWNTLITQYAPLLGLKGVGLLNSYTVWTDRREGSPHQGYAFPAQESEAHFYGEGREELITLNKVLVALDLIAIHKEMVLRQDARGRRWRVPHNFYRVKDPKDGLVLSLPAVVRVLDVARRDRNVFRHIRHIFGPQFSPIDRTSLWHGLLPELRTLPLWQELAAQAARERRTPRKTARAEGGETAAVTPATGADTAPDRPDLTTTIAALTDNDARTTHDEADTGRDFSTFLAPTSVLPGDRDTNNGDNDADLDAAPALRTYVVPRDDAENPSTSGAGGDVGTNDAEGHSMTGEGTAHVELASTPIVRRDDRTHHQGGESREETTRTSSTSEDTRTHARMRERGESPERGRPRQARADAPSAPRGVFHSEDASPDERDVSQEGQDPPARPSVSDLFAALAEENQHRQTEAEDWYRRADLPRAAEVWAQKPEKAVVPDATPGPIPAASPAQDPTHAPTPFNPPDPPSPDAADAADAAMRQPLPPVPGDDGGEGEIVVRALDVREGGGRGDADAGQAAHLAEIEAALAMANGKPPSELALSLLWQVARDCDAAARTQPGPGSGFGWVLAAIREAANSGAQPISPKYIAAICDRWATQGYMSDGRTAPSVASRVAQPPPAWLAVSAPAPDPAPGDDVSHDAAPDPAPTPARAAKGPEPETSVPDDEGTRLWAGVVRRLEGIIHPDALGSRTFAAARVVATAGERVTVRTLDAEGATRLGAYRGLIARRLSDVLGRAVADVRFVPDTATDAPDTPDASMTPDAATNGARPAMGSGPMPVIASPVRHEDDPSPASSARAVSHAAPDVADAAPIASSNPPQPAVSDTEGAGDAAQANDALWARALHTLRGSVSEATFKVWLAPVVLVATDADGTLVIGARNRVQRERLERQHAGEIAAALAAVSGRPVAVRVVVTGDAGRGTP